VQTGDVTAPSTIANAGVGAAAATARTSSPARHVGDAAVNAGAAPAPARSATLAISGPATTGR
jgi:hypothetical protein